MEKAAQFSMEGDSSLPIGGSRYRSNLLYAFENFRTSSTPYLQGSDPNTSGGHQSFADIAKAWLKQVVAPTESATFIEVFKKDFAAKTHIQAPKYN